MTLIELMIAAGVLAIAFVMLFGSLFSVSELGGSTEDRVLANNYVATVLEDVRQLNPEVLVNYTPAQAPGLGARQFAGAFAVANDGSLAQLPFSESSAAMNFPNPTEVQVLVAWIDTAGRRHIVRGSTLKGRR
jgi:type II secretory pathway pseudopilin PulG